jgi:superfamily II DNA or RNA helicase
MSNNTKEPFIEFRKPQRGRLKYYTNVTALDELIRETFTTFNIASRFSKYAPSNICAISPIGGFSSGLFYDIMKIVNNFEIKVKVSVNAEVRSEINPIHKPIIKISQPSNTEFKYYDHQLLAIQNLFKYGRGICHYATSAGKSLIMYGFIKNYLKVINKDCQILILVPNIQLVKQLRGDFVNYGMNPDHICMFSGFSKSYDSNAKIVITNSQFYGTRYNEMSVKPEVVIIDECHMLTAGNKISKLVSKLETPIKFGFSGTVPNDNKDLWYLKGLCGPIIARKMASELQNEGKIVDTNFVMIRFEHTRPAPSPPNEITDPLERAKLKFPLEKEYIKSCDECNETIAKMTTMMANNSIVLFDYTEHGKYLFELITEYAIDKKLFFINGEIDLEYREDVRKEMELHNNCILVANTKCFSTGINIKNIHNIVFSFSHGKASAKILQSVGRGLRNNNNKKFMNLYDFHHDYEYSYKHFRERMKLYKETYNIRKMLKKIIKIDD